MGMDPSKYNLLRNKRCVSNGPGFKVLAHGRGKLPPPPLESIHRPKKCLTDNYTDFNLGYAPPSSLRGLVPLGGMGLPVYHIL